MKILVTDSQLRSSVALIRSFGARGIKVIAADSDKISTGFYSKYAHEKFIYPDILKDESLFIKELSRFVEKENIDIIFPISNEATISIAKHRDLFNNNVKIPITDYDSLIQATNKAFTFKLLFRLGIPIPKTYFPERVADLDIISDFPVILKPAISSGSRGLCLCHNRDELRSCFKGKSEKYQSMIVQEYISLNNGDEGELCWYCIYDQHSTCIGYGCYKTIRRYPIGNGPSTFQESVENKEINMIAKKILDHLQWRGIAQMDFRVDARDNIPKLIEINARCWAPLSHTIQAGLDIPDLWLKFALKKSIKKQSPIKLGVKTRWLLPGDILWFLTAPKNLKNMKKFFTLKGVNFDLIQKNDMKPILGFLLASLMYLFNKTKRETIIR